MATKYTPEPPQRPEPLLSIAEVALWLRVSEETIRHWRASGKGPRATRVGKHLRWEPAEIRTWLAEHRDVA